jgi:hypothetical protein
MVFLSDAGQGKGMVRLLRCRGTGELRHCGTHDC